MGRQKSQGTIQEAGMHRDSLGRGLFSGLVWKMAQKLPPNERATKPPKKLSRPPIKLDLTDEQIAACRRAFEAQERTVKELAEDHRVTPRRMRQIVTYQTRSARADLHQPA